MIYKKDANFPYPVLTNTSNSYESGGFTLNVDLKENTDNYRFDIEYEIESDFLKELLFTRKAKLYLVVQSKDNKFFEVDLNTMFIDIPKTRISINNRTSLQMSIQSKEEISFAYNDDINSFFKEFREEIIVSRYAILGFSNTVIFEGSSSRPFDLFERKVNSALSSAIKIELGSETIIIHYRDVDLQFVGLPMSGNFNNPYIYMGLQKALSRFISNYGEDGQVDLHDIDLPTDQLDAKLYRLMKAKMVFELTTETIDEAIYNISDKVIEKYALAVKGLATSGD
ncbi:MULTISPECIES: hypothetical protein [unclassified Sporosarcina]|uniref:hypothetical protein n=1 Tax=unclassified Sporosarcina TaxID=2647733 RepID=UPI000C169DFE|nr:MULTISPECIES: hypothetical protein [unclassified Sporosarcina]PID06028.1 hypothetical protein CSV66_07430 [Sporosarcina sp. P30]PID09222.1 hypothetical protein CSV65_07430 [Sporosarcina sp. P31]PID12520.1 hypothetical protein CSV64_06900 [Sporosarcina sp. P32b]